MKTMCIPAVDTNWDEVLAFLSEEMENADCGMKQVMAVTVAAEEIFVNISHYAYQPETGEVCVGLDIGADSAVTVRFEDSGVPYDPLAKADPDVTLSAEERSIGGLGILMVKRMMDEVLYEHTGGKNILTLIKRA